MTAATAERVRPKPRSVSKDRLRLWLRLLRGSRMIESELRERLRAAFQITLPQFDVMAALARTMRGMTMTELSRFLMVSNGNVTGIIDRLVADALVVRRVIAKDRRATMVRLTPKGLTLFAEMAAAHEAWVDDLLGQFGRAEAELLIAQLDALTGKIKDRGCPS
jgi:DNA-binding MarR family transcriptional regulator